MGIILLGAPGSGKGTQVKMINERFKFKGISLGDILRREVKSNSSLGKKVKEYMDKGLLVPDDVVSMVVEENINVPDFVLDGYPRNVAQAKNLDDILARKNINLNIVIYLDVNEDTAIKRLSRRRICRICEINYHLENMPPKREGICDMCGKQLIQRDDDRPEVIKRRWLVFQNENARLLEYYTQQNKLITIDATRDAEEVFQDIEKILNDGKRTYT